MDSCTARHRGRARIHLRRCGSAVREHRRYIRPCSTNSLSTARTRYSVLCHACCTIHSSFCEADSHISQKEVKSRSVGVIWTSHGPPTTRHTIPLRASQLLPSPSLIPTSHSLAGLDTMHGQRATGYQAGLTKSDDGLWCDRIPPSSLARAAPRAQRRKPLATWPAQDAATLSAYELYSGRSIRPVTAPGLSRWLE